MMVVYDVIEWACKVNRSGEVILEQLLCLQDSDVHVLGLPNLRETIATTSWYLWFERRQLTHGGQTQTSAQIFLALKTLTTNYVIACSPKAKKLSMSWMKPHPGYVKLNVDAGFDQDNLNGRSVQISTITLENLLPLQMKD